MTVTLTPEVLADLRKRAESARDEADCVQVRDWGAQNPKDDAVEKMLNVLPRREWPAFVLALLDRIEELEAKWERPREWRCDGCGATQRPSNGRRPDHHDGCGGVWTRL